MKRWEEWEHVREGGMGDYWRSRVVERADAAKPEGEYSREVKDEPRDWQIEDAPPPAEEHKG